MPILTVKVSVPKSRTISDAIVSLLMDATRDVLKKKPDDTAIAIDFVDAEDWYVAGRPLSETRQASFFMDIRITDETNTKAEKAAYIRQVFDGFNRLLGNLNDKSYIQIHDVRATSYGYGGETQEYRFHH
ncbi:4-oxalocrotonate tautomerase [Rhodospirillaceae bacterium KN72]|uniref:4-oxalocrotonate tautomerase n=1 Tax=Pacificispira spongiicola TaxID=2729598 RepID=A0A7Y0HHA8_9PROT|nr:tautomerase family protein [Pacificispira spongiicola]NMM46523.1 4-oxalocrotonate tautomerase [Pacificispira spongiicola]